MREPLLRKILVSLDGSVLAELALPHAKALAQKFDARLILLWVIEPMPLILPVMDYAVVPDEYVELSNRLEEQAERYLSRLCKSLLEQDVATNVLVIRSDSVTDAIVDFAEQEGVDLIVKTDYGRSGISRWVFSSITCKLLEQASCPVFIVKVNQANN